MQQWHVTYHLIVFLTKMMEIMKIHFGKKQSVTEFRYIFGAGIGPLQLCVVLIL